MDIIIAILFIAVLVIIIGLLTYFTLKEPSNKISKDIIYYFEEKCEDNLDELIEFSKLHNTKYKI